MAFTDSLFGAVCPARGVAAGLVLPTVNTEAMSAHLAEISRSIAPGAHGVLTQIVAAERAGRRCFAMELDPVYCDVAVRRWEMATGMRGTCH